MSFKTAFDDFMDYKKTQDRNSLPQNIPLHQGRTYLRDRGKICNGLKKNLTLIEGFDDQGSSNVVAGETHNPDTYNTDYRAPVRNRNKKEFDELEKMQNSFFATQSAWKDQYQHVITLVQGQPVEMQKCLTVCKDKKDIDSISACMYGCNTGKFAMSGATQRVTQDPGPPPTWALFADALAVLAGPVLAEIAPELVTGVIGATVSDSTEGFTTQAPQTTGQASDSIPDNVKVMGTYGPTGYGKGTDGKVQASQAINNMLASKPKKGDFNLLKQFDNTHGWNFTKGDPQQTNPSGLFSIKENATATAAFNLSKTLSNDPLVIQMQNTNIDATNIGPYVEKLRSNWKGIFDNSCKVAIGGFGNVQTGTTSVNSGPFAGHSQNCKSWVNTAEDRSGYYNTISGNQPFTVNSQGIKQPFSATPIPLANVAPKGCDAVIPGSRSSDTQLGGSGYCICADGTKAGFVDNNHASFTCNEACAPQNKSLHKQPLYHNTKNWKPALPYNTYHGSKTVTNAAEAASGSKASAPFLQCGNLIKQSNGTYVPGPVPECPNGMEAAPWPVSADPTCGYESWDRQRRKCEGFMGICWFGGWVGEDRDAGSATAKGQRCRYTSPAGYNKPAVDNIGKLGKLPTQSQLLDSCSGGDGDTPYQNLYLDMLQLKVLGLVMQQKAAIIYKVIKESYSGSRATALKRTEVGTSILKNMKLYESSYKNYRAQQNKRHQTDGMFEDIMLKSKSTNISYYLWFALAMSGMGLVIKQLSK